MIFHELFVFQRRSRRLRRFRMPLIMALLPSDNFARFSEPSIHVIFHEFMFLAASKKASPFWDWLIRTLSLSIAVVLPGVFRCVQVCPPVSGGTVGW